MIRAGLLSLVLMTTACHHAAPPASPAPTAATAVRLITSDIPNFWRAYDLAAGKDSAEQVRIFQTVYLQPGSPGLRDWMWLRLVNRDVVRARLVAGGWTAARIDSLARQPRGTPARDTLDRARQPIAEQSAAEMLVLYISRYPRYYAAVRAATLSLDTAQAVTQHIRDGLARLTQLYPDAQFPSVYFVIGIMSTGGTVGRSGMLIGTEQVSSGPDTPRDELPQWARDATAANSFDRLPRMIVHEAVHTQQARMPQGSKDTLLRHALGEGIADLLAELALGRSSVKSPRELYGEAHEHAVWLDFKTQMATDSTINQWMYNGSVPPDKNHGAVDIGYWVGYRIARAYYNQARDKRAAVQQLLLLTDPERLLAESGYNP